MRRKTSIEHRTSNAERRIPVQTPRASEVHVSTVEAQETPRRGLLTSAPANLRSVCAFTAITRFSIRRFRPRPSSNCAKQHGLSAVALTDIGNLHGAVEFAQAAKQRPASNADFGRRSERVRAAGGHTRLLLYVESARGYHNL